MIEVTSRMPEVYAVALGALGNMFKEATPRLVRRVLLLARWGWPSRRSLGFLVGRLLAGCPWWALSVCPLCVCVCCALVLLFFGWSLGPVHVVRPLGNYCWACAGASSPEPLRRSLGCSGRRRAVASGAAAASRPAAGQRRASHAWSGPPPLGEARRLRCAVC